MAHHREWVESDADGNATELILEDDSMVLRRRIVVDPILDANQAERNTPQHGTQVAGMHKVASVPADIYQQQRKLWSDGPRHQGVTWHQFYFAWLNDRDNIRWKTTYASL